MTVEVAKTNEEFAIQQKNSHTSLDSKNGSVGGNGSLDGTAIVADHYVDKKLERRIRLKLDLRTLPLICLIYLFNALNKGNISNAKTDTIQEDLGISGEQWNLMLSIFYIPFVLFAFPLSLVIKRFNASRVIPILAVGFGSINLLLVSAFNFGGLMAGRFFLGLCEAPILPGVIYYLSTFYRRHELASRLSIIYCFSSIANAFSGLLAFGCFQINDPRLSGWQILFLLEGSLTLVIAATAYFCLPRTIQGCSFLTEEEREYAQYRILTDSSAAAGETFELRDALRVFKQPVILAWLFEEVCIGVPLNSINNWFPQIIQALGRSTVQTNLFTVAPNVWGALSLLVFAFWSDHVRIRSCFLVVAIGVTLTGFVVYGAIDIENNTAGAYFACFLMTTGASASSVLTSTWYNNNTPNENRRIAVSAVGIPLANAAGLISANIFLPQDAPKYVPALGITAGFGGMAILVVSSIAIFMKFDNDRRNKRQGVNYTYRDVPTSQLREGPANPNFRWMY